jgi:hypothetical protein
MITFPHRPFGSIATFSAITRNLTGSTSIAGATQVIGSGAGLWQATVTNIVIRDRQTNLLWRTIDGLLEGRRNPILIPTCEGKRQPFPSFQLGAYGLIPHSDGTYFSDRSGYSQKVIAATLTADIARGAAQASLNVAVGGVPEPGQYFSIGARLYRIKSISALAGPLISFSFWPPAREAAGSGSVVEFDQPVCKMRLKDDNAFQIDMNLNRRATPSLDFIEDVS